MTNNLDVSTLDGLPSPCAGQVQRWQSQLEKMFIFGYGCTL